MKVEFPAITIGGIDRKVYSIDLSGGGSSPASLSVSFLTDSSIYNPSSQIEYAVSIGNFYNFIGYITTVSTRESANGNTTEITLVDTSIKLDKIFVGLKGKHGPPQAFLGSSANYKKQLPNQIDVYKVSPTVTSNTLNTNKLSNLSIFETQGNFPPENFIFLGDAIDPCRDILENQIDPCDPCSSSIEGAVQSLLDCERNRSFQILDVDYTFPDLIRAAQAKGITFNNLFSHLVNYRAQYTGTLREVLSSWCQDFGYTFYWRDNGIHFINLQRGIEINDSLVQQQCRVEEKVVSKSIEGNQKRINIAYFGKAGEIKEYDCNKSNSAQDTVTKPITLEPISLSLLLEGNTSLTNPYRGANNFRKIVAAGEYSKELRDLFCWKDVYGYKTPAEVKVGKHSLMGWNVKAVCHQNTADDQVVDYDTGIVRSMYQALLTPDPSRGDFYSEENIKKLKEAGAYFVIAETHEEKAFAFERDVAEAFCGKYWLHSTNSADAEVSHPDGSSRIVKGVYGNANYVLPDLNINHPYITSSKSRLMDKLKAGVRKDDTLVVILERPQYWIPDGNSVEAEDFVQIISKCAIQEVEYSTSFAGLKDNDKLFLVYSFNDEERQPKLESLIEEGTHILENSFDSSVDLGPTNRRTLKVSFFVQPPNALNFKLNKKLQILMPSEANYRALLTPYKSRFTVGPIKAVIPKFEAIITEQNAVDNDDYVSVQVNYQNITDTDIGKLSAVDGKCFIDKSKVFTYGQNIIRDLSNDIPQIRKTINYIILGIPDAYITPEDGLTGFSIKMDSGGTRTNLTFSNSFPESRSDSVKRHEMMYLLKNQAIKIYINNLL